MDPALEQVALPAVAPHAPCQVQKPAQPLSLVLIKFKSQGHQLLLLVAVQLAARALCPLLRCPTGKQQGGWRGRQVPRGTAAQSSLGCKRVPDQSLLAAPSAPCKLPVVSLSAPDAAVAMPPVIGPQLLKARAPLGVAVAGQAVLPRLHARIDATGGRRVCACPAETAAGCLHPSLHEQRPPWCGSCPDSGLLRPCQGPHAPPAVP